MNTTDLDMLKAGWQSLNAPASGNNRSRSVCRPVAVKSVTARERLVSFYRRVVAVCTVWTGVSLCYLCGDLFPWWMSSLLAVYFALMGMLTYRVLRSARRIDFGSMSVIEAMEAVCEVQSRRTVQRTVGMMICIPLLSVMFMFFASVSRAMLLGGVIGLVVGAGIGILMELRVRRWIREMKEAIREATEE